MNKIKILVAEDDKDIRDLIHFNLFKAGFEVFLADNGAQAVSLAKDKVPDVIILDIMMPKLDGISACKVIRNTTELEGVGIIMLTAKGTDTDIVSGLDAGADDYITKPFSSQVLLARVHAIARRKKYSNLNTDKDDYSFCGIKINAEFRTTFIDNKELELTFTEFELLRLLILSPGRVFSRSEIVDIIKGNNHAITDRSVDVQVVGLRKKMGEKGKLIETVWGVGYRFKQNRLANIEV